MFFAVLLFVLVGTHAYLYLRLQDYFAFEGLNLRLLQGVTAFMAVFLVAALPLTRMLPFSVAAPVSFIAYTWMGFLLVLFGVSVVADFFWLLVRVFAPEMPLSLKPFVGWGVLGVATLLSTYAVFNALRPPVVKQLTVRVANLPPQLAGLKLAQLTDLHIGHILRGNWLSKVVQQVNALEPDIVAITGDLMDGSVQQLAPEMASLAHIKTSKGVYYITGNHEYYSGANEWCAYLPRLGLKVLRNANIEVAQGLVLAGVDDVQGISFGQGPNFATALAGIDPNAALILLNHQPQTALVKAVANKGVGLQLSGHTHGGQIWPATWVVRLLYKYDVGLHRVKNTAMQVFTSVGTGFWGPPMRLGTRGEIVLLTLQP